METALRTVGPAHNTTHVNLRQPALTENACAGQPNIHQSQFSNSALASVSYPKE